MNEDTDSLVSQAIAPLTGSKERIMETINCICNPLEKEAVVILISRFEKLIEKMWEKELKINKCKYVIELPKEKYDKVCKRLGMVQIYIFKILLGNLVKYRQDINSLETIGVGEFMKLWSFWKKV